MKNKVGRPALGYETKSMRVPLALIPKFASEIAQYKLDGEKNERTNTNANKAS